MKFETSSDISSDQVASIEKILRQAAIESKNEKFFGPNDKIEIVKNPSAPSVEQLAREGTGMKPMGNPTVCAIAYEAARRACNGNANCEALAYIAYQICLRS